MPTDAISDGLSYRPADVDRLEIFVQYINANLSVHVDLPPFCLACAAKQFLGVPRYKVRIPILTVCLDKYGRFPWTLIFKIEFVFRHHCSPWKIPPPQPAF